MQVGWTIKCDISVTAWLYRLSCRIEYSVQYLMKLYEYNEKLEILCLSSDHHTAW